MQPPTAIRRSLQVRRVNNAADDNSKSGSTHSLFTLARGTIYMWDDIYRRDFCNLPKPHTPQGGTGENHQRGWNESEELS